MTLLLVAVGLIGFILGLCAGIWWAEVEQRAHRGD